MRPTSTIPFKQAALIAVSARTLPFHADELNVLFDAAVPGSAGRQNDLAANAGNQVTPHAAISSAAIYFSTEYNWHFNETAIPEPATLSLLALGSLVALRRRRR